MLNAHKFFDLQKNTMVALKNIATYGLGMAETGTMVSLHIARGSVLDFAAPAVPKRVGAIVNAANKGCLGGGGVDGAINDAGGPKLWEDRKALPLRKGTIRCPTGGAVVTGPGDYGSLNVPYVIHAVGPNYSEYGNFSKPDARLRSAYQESLERCKERGITDVGFSLLSAGHFRGDRTLKAILTISVKAINDWVADEMEEEQDQTTCAPNATSGDEQPSQPHRLRSITLYGFSKKEVDTLMNACEAVFEASDSEEDGWSDSDSDDGKKEG